MPYEASGNVTVDPLSVPFVGKVIVLGAV